MGDPDGAIRYLDEAIRLRPNLAGAFNDRGVAYMAKGDTDRAVQDFNEAILLNPADVPALYNRGRAYMENTNAYEQAIADFNEALRLRPQFAKALHARGMIKLKKGDSAGANADMGGCEGDEPRCRRAVRALRSTTTTVGVAKFPLVVPGSAGLPSPLDIPTATWVPCNSFKSIGPTASIVGPIVGAHRLLTGNYLI